MHLINSVSSDYYVPITIATKSVKICEICGQIGFLRLGAFA